MKSFHLGWMTILLFSIGFFIENLVYAQEEIPPIPGLTLEEEETPPQPSPPPATIPEKERERVPPQLPPPPPPPPSLRSQPALPPPTPSPTPATPTPQMSPSPSPQMPEAVPEIGEEIPHVPLPSMPPPPPRGGSVDNAISLPTLEENEEELPSIPPPPPSSLAPSPPSPSSLPLPVTPSPTLPSPSAPTPTPLPPTADQPSPLPAPQSPPTLPSSTATPPAPSVAVPSERSQPPSPSASSSMKEDIDIPPSPPSSSGSGKKMTDAIAIVEGQPIQRSEFYEALVTASGRDVLQKLVNLYLLRAEMKRRNLSISEAELESAFQEHAARFAKGLPPGDKTAFTEHLTNQLGMTPPQYKERVIWVELAMRKLVTENLPITSADLFNYYYQNLKNYTVPEQVVLSHILISPFQLAQRKNEAGVAIGNEEWNEASRIAEEIFTKLQGGADFAELARTMSHDKASMEKGGEIGAFPRGVLQPAIENVVFTLHPGEITRPIKTMHGYHILKVHDRIPPRRLPFREVQDRVQKDYEEYVMITNSALLLDKLREEAIQKGKLQILEKDLMELLQ